MCMLFIHVYGCFLNNKLFSMQSFLTVCQYLWCRAYLSVKELKELLHLSSSDTLNVFFANNSAREELAGVATWPWAKEAITHQGKMDHKSSWTLLSEQPKSSFIRSEVMWKWREKPAKWICKLNDGLWHDLTTGDKIMVWLVSMAH